MDTIYILTKENTHSACNRAEFIAGMESRGAKVEFIQSRISTMFEVVKVNGHAVARAFKTEAAMFAQFLASNS